VIKNVIGAPSEALQNKTKGAAKKEQYFFELQNALFSFVFICFHFDPSYFISA
jgi:hypothetical protein